MSPQAQHCVVLFFWSWNVCCLHLKFRSCARGCQCRGIYNFHWWKASIKPRLLFSLCKLCFLRTFPFLWLIKLWNSEKCQKVAIICKHSMIIRLGCWNWNRINNLSPSDCAFLALVVIGFNYACWHSVCHCGKNFTAEPRWRKNLGSTVQTETRDYPFCQDIYFAETVFPNNSCDKTDIPRNSETLFFLDLLKNLHCVHTKCYSEILVVWKLSVHGNLAITRIKFIFIVSSL